jgi:hypothetical protein
VQLDLGRIGCTLLVLLLLYVAFLSYLYCSTILQQVMLLLSLG